MEAMKTDNRQIISPRGDAEGAAYILGIESSCDDTSAAVLKDGFLLSNVTAL